MMKIMVLAVLFVYLFSSLKAKEAMAKVSDLEGKWYSPDAKELQAELNGYMNLADTPKISDEVIGVISPHAGYRFSGPIAAYSYKVIQEKKPEKIILIAFSHKFYIPGKVSILNDDFYSTPLGKIEIDKALTAKLISGNNGIEYIPKAFEEENSVELQIPFIQLASPSSKLVVLVLCDQREENCNKLALALSETLKNEKSYIIVASTDLSHFLEYSVAREKDLKTIEIMKKLKAEDLYRACLKEDPSNGLMCGNGAVYTLMKASEKLGGDKFEILKYANSGDTFGDKKRVVGYLSAVIVKSGLSEKIAVLSEKGKTMEGSMFNESERKELLYIARETIEQYLKTGKRAIIKSQDDSLMRNMGAFVTLHKKGELRGCIGHMIAVGPIINTVQEMAIAAAVQDPRFLPVTLSEMKDIDIEISALSPMRKIQDYNEIELGKHGVMVKSGNRSGVYLPQLATETAWNKEEFMNSLCEHKAGISSNAWKNGTCEIYVFTAEVFGEKNIGNK